MGNNSTYHHHTQITRCWLVDPTYLSPSVYISSSYSTYTYTYYLSSLNLNIIKPIKYHILFIHHNYNSPLGFLGNCLLCSLFYFSLFSWFIFIFYICHLIVFNLLWSPLLMLWLFIIQYLFSYVNVLNIVFFLIFMLWFIVVFSFTV